MRTNDHAFWRIINALYLTLVFIASYFLIHLQTEGVISADTRQHLHFMEQFFNGQVYIPHPIWHIGTYYLSHLFALEYGAGASLFTAFIVTLYVVTVYKVAKSFDKARADDAKYFLVTLLSCTIGPFFILSFNPHIYMGTGSPSVWHNVTLLTVKPLALLSVFFTVRFLSSNSDKYLYPAIIISILSIFAKPNFIIVFLPSLILYIIMKRYFFGKRLIFAFAVTLLSMAALAYQFLNQYESGNSKGGSIIFDFLGVWSLYTPNVLISIATALGLPLLISLFNYQSVKDNEYIKFTWLLVLFSMVLFSCFAESGDRYAAGNFSWSWMISLSLIYLFSIIEYFKQYYAMRPLVRYALLMLMLYQVYVGWYFLIEMFNGVAFNHTVNDFPLF